MNNRSRAREEAFQVLFQIDVNELIDRLPKHPFAKQLVQGVMDNKDQLDKVIENHLINWSLDRISLVDKTILRIAVFEIIYLDDIPYAVSINEAVELAHTYGDDKSSKFINGILSKITEKGELN